MRIRPLALLLTAIFVALPVSPALAQGDKSGMSTVQRLDLVRSKLEALRRSLSSALAGIPAKPADKDKKAAADVDDPRVRLQGLDKEASSLLSEESDLHNKA